MGWVIIKLYGGVGYYTFTFGSCKVAYRHLILISQVRWCKPIIEQMTNFSALVLLVVYSFLSISTVSSILMDFLSFTHLPLSPLYYSLTLILPNWAVKFVKQWSSDYESWEPDYIFYGRVASGLKKQDVSEHVTAEKVEYCFSFPRNQKCWVTSEFLAGLLGKLFCCATLNVHWILFKKIQ